MRQYAEFHTCRDFFVGNGPDPVPGASGYAADPVLEATGDGGVPGTNPNDMARDPHLREVGRWF